MEGIAVVGFGGQGIQAVANARVSRNIACKFFIDNDRMLLEGYVRSGKCIAVDFDYEEGLWNPGCKIRMWLKDEENRDMVLQTAEGFSMLIFVTGLGGTMSLAAKELAEFFLREKPEMAIYFICSLPFHDETDYKHNYLSRVLLEFLRKGEVGWTVIENDKILPLVGNDPMAAYTASFEYIAYLLEGIFSLLGTGIWNSRIDFSELKDMLKKGLVYITVFEEAEDLAEKMPLLGNRLLPYMPDHDSGQILMSLEIAKGMRLLGVMAKIDKALNQEFSSNCGCSCRMYYGRKGIHTYKLVVLSAGTESREKNISIREICL